MVLFKQFFFFESTFEEDFSRTDQWKNFLYLIWMQLTKAQYVARGWGGKTVLNFSLKRAPQKKK